LLLGNLRRYDAKLVPWDTAGTSKRFATRRDGEGLKRSLCIARASLSCASQVPQGVIEAAFSFLSPLGRVLE